MLEHTGVFSTRSNLATEKYVDVCWIRLGKIRAQVPDRPTTLRRRYGLVTFRRRHVSILIICVITAMMIRYHFNEITIVRLLLSYVDIIAAPASKLGDKQRVGIAKQQSLDKFCKTVFFYDNLAPGNAHFIYFPHGISTRHLCSRIGCIYFSRNKYPLSGARSVPAHFLECRVSYTKKGPIAVLNYLPLLRSQVTSLGRKR